MGLLSCIQPFVIVLILLRLTCSSALDWKRSSHSYSNSFAVHIPNGDDEKANKIAKRHGMLNLGQVGLLEGIYHFQHLSQPRRMRRQIIERTSRLSRESEVKWVEQQVIKRRVKRGYLATFNDPLWRQQWYLHNIDKTFNQYDHNVIPVWKELNITGRGVSVSILDDGIEKNHPDLRDNYDPKASYDFNSHDDDPSPRPTYSDENRHGTRCAGEVAAAAGNNVCGVGVAYGAKIGGIRMLDGDVTDIIEAHSLSYNPLDIDIYSSSWGPDDDGKTVDGPGPLAKKAFEGGIAKGRGGLGNIFVWASGNGGRDDDNCNCDGYTNSIFTLSISSATEHGTSPWYSEKCASTLASTFSSGSFNMRKVVTTDLHNKCTTKHTGTSASAPLAAGILALALEANPKLTWRDMQHIVVRTSKSDKLKSNDWATNGVGRKVSHRFGYGLLDAEALVKTAIKWKTVPAKHDCFEPADTHNRPIPRTGALTVEKETTGCEGTPDYIRYLEHLEVVISLRFSRRGDLTIHVTSPQGTRATLLGKRRMDYNSHDGFKNWVFMSTHTWEENPKGKWKVEIANDGSPNTGALTSWQLRFHGTQNDPGVGYENCAVECKGGCSGPNAGDCVECAHYKSNGICVNECPGNEYADNVTKECLGCHNHCFECFGPGAGQCTACKPPGFLYDGKCLSRCPEKWFGSNEKTCVECGVNCASCSGKANFCTACEDDHQLVYNKCVINCKKNEYVEGNRCRACHPSCTACSNSTAWSCTECGTDTLTTREGVKQALYLHRGMCVATCPSGFYGDVHHCVPCHSSCKHCSGPLQTECTSCKAGLVKVSNGSGLCLDECPTGYSHGISENACVKCGPSCSACDPDEPFRCTACDRGLFLWKQKCVKPETCPGNTFPEPSANKCEDCHPSCATCVGPPTQCTSCAGFLHLHGDKCIPECPIGTYGKDYKCLPCSSNCSDCFGGGRDQCLKCTKGFYLVTNKCVKKCPEGMFVENATARCQHCSMTCESCRGNATNCIKCKGGLKKVNGLCLSVCEHGTFLSGTMPSSDNFSSNDSSNNISSNDSSSDNISSDNISSNDSSNNISSNDSSSDNISSNDSSSDNISSNDSSSDNISSNDSSSDNISSDNISSNDSSNNISSNNFSSNNFSSNNFSSNNISSNNFSSNNFSSNNIPSNNFPANNISSNDPSNNFSSNVSSSNKSSVQKRSVNRCSKCHPSCLTCIGGTKFDCLRCKGVKFHDPTNKLCSFNCPVSGFYEDIQSTLCKPCLSECKECTNHTSCTKCAPGFVLHNRQCVPHCPEGFYTKNTSNTCEKCGSVCKHCSGSSSTCVSCNAPQILFNDQCIRECPTGKFLSKAFHRCLPCDDSCLTCVGPGHTRCTYCNSSKVLFQAQCRSSCPARYYYNPDTKQCQPCDYYCHRCHGGNGLSNCTECVPPFVLEKHMCVRTCSGGKVLDRERKRCVYCHHSCAKCLGTTDHDCLSCSDSKATLEGSVCKNSCGVGKYRVPNASYCQRCQPTCKSCRGRGQFACTGCVGGLIYSLAEKQCLSQCPQGQYRIGGDCYTCSSSCKSCKGASSGECLSCKQNHVLHNFTCVKRCPPNTHLEDYNGLMECGTCYPSCATCTGKAANQCTSCRQDLYLEETSCVKQCSNWKNFRLDEDTRTCKLCNDDCPSYANLTDRSVNVPNNNNRGPLTRKHKNHFVLIAMATATSLLVVFALINTLRANSSRGYKRVQNNSTSNVEEHADLPSNNVPQVYVRNDNLEKEELLERNDDEM